MEETRNIYYTCIFTKIGKMDLASTGKGLCAVGLGNMTQEEFLGPVRRTFRGYKFEESPRRNSQAAKEIEEYLQGKLRVFTSPLDLVGTPFQLRVWQELMRIPYGSTRTYAQVAEKIGSVSLARAVGAACGANPVPIVVPCHRVIASDGTLGGFGGGLAIKQMLLDLEAGARKATGREASEDSASS